MKINFSYDKNFDDLIFQLKEKYGERLFEIDGIGDVQLDMDTFSRQFYRLDKKAKVVADISVDPNANVDDRTSIAYTVESPKAMFRLNAYYILWRKIKQLYGIEEANTAVEANISGALYIHDFHSFASAYCYAYSVADIMREGLPFITKVKSIPCKHYDTFVQHVIQATVYYSNSIAGAVSLPDLFVCWAWYIKKDIEAGYLHNGGSTSIKKKLEQQFQILVYTLNQPFRGGLQSLVSSCNHYVFSKNKTEKVSIGDFADRFFSGVGYYDLSKHGYKIESLNKSTGKLEIKEINGIYRHKVENKVVTYTTALNQQISVTDNHSLFTLDDNFYIKECKSSDNPKNILIPFNNYKPEKVILDGIGFNDKWAYLMGQYVGDGNCDGSGMYIHSYNKEFGEWAKEQFTDITVTQRKKNGKPGPVYLGVGKKVIKIIEKYFGKGSHNKFITPLIKNSDCVMSFIQGYIDSDGTLTKKTKGQGAGKVRISSCNKGLLYDFQGLLLNLGIFSTITRTYREGFGKYSYIYNLLVSNYYKLQGKIKKNTTLIDCADPTRRWVDFKKVYTRLVKNYALNLSKLGIGSYDHHNFSLNNLLELVKKIEISIEKGITQKDLFDKARYLFMPLSNTPNCRLYKINKYNKQYDLQANRNIDTFLTFVNDRYLDLSKLCTRIKKLYHVIPIKVKAIKNTKYDDPYVYDFSVQDNENFNTETNIYAHNSSFTNFSIFDRPFLESLFEHTVYPDGTSPNFEEIDELQKHFSSWFIKEYKHNIFTFPVMTACLAVDENNDIIDKNFLDWVSEINLINGIFNIYTGEVTNISACCRLRTSLKNEYTNSFGSGGISIGSVRVCTINLPHIAFLAGGNKNKFKKLLDKYLEITYQILYAQRKVLEKRIKQKVAPLYTLGFMHLKRQYSTVGVVGMYEMLELLDIPMETVEGKVFVKELLLYFADMNVKQQKKTGWMYNTEQTPVEAAAPKLAAKDKILFGEENHKWSLYSNQFYALTSEVSLVNRIKTQGMFDKLMDGGAILHINVAEKIKLKSQMYKLIQFAAKQGVVYFAVNYQMNRCVEGHLTIGEMDLCSICGGEIKDKFTRVVGFYTNIKTWNKTRRDIEYPERKFYSSILEKGVEIK